MPLAGDLYYFLHEGGGQRWPPVLLLHGAGGDHLSWPADIRRLPEARVLALDLPGHGKSGGPGRQSVEAYVQALKEFLDRTDTGRAFLVGHCLGGALALATAVLHPDRVTGLALLSTGARLPVASLILENAANPSTFSLALKALQEASLGPAASPALREANAQRLRAIRQTLLYGDLLACDRFDLTSSVGTIRAPTLVLCGTEDRLTPPHLSESLSRRIPAAALQTIDGAGHLLPLEQPVRLAKLLKMFVGSTRVD